MKNCNCKETETITLCKPDPCNCVCKMPVDECTNRVIYYITLASAVLISCDNDKTVADALNEIYNRLQQLDVKIDDLKWENVIEHIIEYIKNHLSDLELTDLIDDRINEIVNLNSLITVFNDLFNSWKTLLNDLISQASTIVLDDNVTENSSNGVKSSGIYAAINNLPLPDWNESNPTLHSYIKNKPIFHIGFATSDYNSLTSNEKDTVEFKIKAKNFIGTGIWNYEDVAAMACAIKKTSTEANYQSLYNNYIDSNLDIQSISLMVGYILNTRYYPVLIEPLKNNPYPESGVYYDLNSESFFNLIKGLNNNYKARYLKRGPVVIESHQLMILGAISSNILGLEKENADVNQFTLKMPSTLCSGFGNTPEIRLCTGTDYMSVGDGTYPVSGLQKMSYDYIEVENVSKNENVYTGIIRNVKLKDNYNNLYELYLLQNDGNEAYNVTIDSESGDMTLTLLSTNNEP